VNLFLTFRIFFLLQNFSPNGTPICKRLRLRQGDTLELEPLPEPEPAPPVEAAEPDFEAARAALERLSDIESMKNPTPAMLLQLERMKNRYRSYDHLIFAVL
jgi:hypothetical protein